MLPLSYSKRLAIHFRQWFKEGMTEYIFGKKYKNDGMYIRNLGKLQNITEKHCITAGWPTFSLSAKLMANE